MDFKKSNNDFAKKLSVQCGYKPKEVMELPSKISFEFDKINTNQINILLTKEAAMKNMQEDDAAFEGWILAILLKCQNRKKYTIYLDVNNEFEQCGKTIANRGTYNRIIYRINRFHKQFSSLVKISPKLQSISNTLIYVEEGKDKGKDKGELKEEKIDKINLVVNRPDKAAGINKNPEIILETLFSIYPSSLLNETENMIKKPMNEELNRQLPVGVFNEKVAKDNMIFTAGHAAIDLWGLSKDNEDLCIYELKKPVGNNKVGIVSELFFYANLMYDLYCEENNFSISDENSLGRGFNKIIDAQGKIKKIHAFFLVNELHKEIKNVVNILNQNTTIDYQLIQYSMKFN